MHPTLLGACAMVLGLLIAFVGFASGGNIITVGIGLIFVILGGVTKNRQALQTCPRCHCAWSAATAAGMISWPAVQSASDSVVFI